MLLLAKTFLSSFLFLGLGSNLAAKEWKALVIGTEAPYPPWANVRADGSLEGFDIDFANQVCLRTKMTCRTVALAFDDLIPSLATQKIDVIISGFEVTTRRNDAILFSRTYAEDAFVFVIQNSSPLGNLDGAGKNIDLTDGGAQPIVLGWKNKLNGKKIAVQTSTRGDDFAKKFLQQTTIVALPSATEILQSVNAGTTDIALLTERAAIELLQKPAFAKLRTVGAVARGDVLGLGVAVGIRKSDTDLKQMIDQEISKGLGDGTLLSMSMKWFGTDLRPK